MIKSKRILLASLIAGLMSGCGGGGGSTTTPTTTPTPTKTVVVAGDLTPAVGQSVSLIATIDGERSDAADISWTQTSGEPLSLVAKNSAVLAFDILKAGDYGFKVDFTTKSGKKYSKDVNFTTTTATNILNVRRDFASREGNKVSFKLSNPVDPVTGNVVTGTFTNVTWAQASGPTIILDAKNTNTYTAIFKAPVVDKDTVITFDVSALHPNGTTVTDKVNLLVQDMPAISGSSVLSQYNVIKTQIAKIAPFNLDSKYSDGLKHCVYSHTFNVPCSMNKLNLIGQDFTLPTVDQIMDRVVTSHPWMAENFRKFLIEEDPHGDFKKLLRSVSAIVISFDIRPSFYWAGTSAIYLDAEDLWLTPEQRDVIDVAPDYRSAFGKELNYLMPWRYVKDDDYASSHYSKKSRFTRTIKDLVPDLGSLLYHELAHANDTFPSSTLSSVTGTSVYNAFQLRKGNTIADKLTTAHPKTSTEMMALGQVNFRGATITDAQKAYTPDDVANFFSHDNAPTEYAYSSIQEDVATLFDAAMMSARYGIERDEAVISLKDADDSSKSYIISWGQRGRVTDPVVMPRSKFVFDLIFPELDSDTFYGALPAVRAFTVGDDWISVLEFEKTSSAPQKARGTTTQRPIELDLIRRYK